MCPPMHPVIWQSLAHAWGPVANAFARLARFAQGRVVAEALRADGPFYDDCYPSPYPWPGPVWVRPSFAGWRWQAIAYGAGKASFGFHLAPNTVESAAIITITRGSVTCGNRPLSSWRFVRPPFRPVWRTIFNAAALVHLAAQLRPICWARTHLPAQLSAASAAWFATTLTSVVKPRSTGLHSTGYQNYKNHSGPQPGWSFYFRRASSRPEGNLCSKRY